NNIVRNSKFHNDSIGTSPGGGEVLVGMGQNNVLYNNLVYNSLGGIMVNYGATGTQLLNNTVYGNTDYNFAGIDIAGSHDGHSPPSNTLVENNIMYQNGIDYKHVGTNTTSDYNLTGDSTAVGTHSKNNTNPLFVNATGSNFQLQTGSAAINAGTALTQAPEDRAGVFRPLGTAYDLGAYE